MSNLSPPKTKYLTNKDLLKEIHKSKVSYCSYLDPKYADYDLIVTDFKKITKKKIEEIRKKKLNELKTQYKKAGLDKKDVKPPVLKDIPVESIVIRVMTFEHIPINPDKFETGKTEAEKHVKVNFPPFQHVILKDNKITCVLKSHWKDGLENGCFSKEHGKMTHQLASMFVKLVERYGHRGNWRGYCVDEATEALTQRGWLGIDEITENDIILSYLDGNLKWSKIKSIYRSRFDGLMHKIDVQGTDMFITPGHKLMTTEGLVRVEYLKETHKVILMGKEVKDTNPPIYLDSFVELAGWIVTEGCYEYNPEKTKLKRICIYQNEGVKAERIRNCLKNLGYTFSERINTNNGNITFAICRADSRKIQEILYKKNLNMNFILSLTATQRKLLIDTMIDGDGWRTGNKKQHRRYVQKNKEHVDLFQILCALSGWRTNPHLSRHTSYGKIVSYYSVNIFSERKNTTRVECMNFHGGKRNGRNSGFIGKGKIYHPNKPTIPYNGRVWCPETEYGCFIARRNGTVYLTGNTYLDEMKSQALLQLSQVGLQFDESKGNNFFSYGTQIVANSFLRILNLEKRNQVMRDDLLIMNNQMPSYTRQTENYLKQQNITDYTIAEAELKAKEKEAKKPKKKKK